MKVKEMKAWLEDKEDEDVICCHDSNGYSDFNSLHDFNDSENKLLELSSEKIKTFSSSDFEKTKKPIVWPQYVIVGKNGGALEFDRLLSEGLGGLAVYYRRAGGWSTVAKHKDGKYFCRNKDKFYKHLEGVELTPTTYEFWRKDNEGHL